MTEAALYERIGRAQTAFEQQNVEYRLLLDLLSKVVSGEITRDRVTVDVKAASWRLDPPAEPKPTEDRS